MSWTRALTLFAGALLLASAVLATLGAPTGAPAQRVVITPGMGAGQVAELLRRRGLIRSGVLLRTLLRLQGAAGAIEAGAYRFSGAQNLWEVAHTLEGGGAPVTVKVVIPEGYTLRQVERRLRAAGLGSVQTYHRLFAQAALSRYARGSLEGFLFPATYAFTPGEAPEQVVLAMVRRMEREFLPSRLAEARALGLSPFAWVTLASMVQAEAGSNAQMPRVAGVFLNRLRAHMPLQSDPTVAYGLHIPANQLDYARGDFAKPTPYNTYLLPGLPAGPIDNPGQAALLAVLHPSLTVHGKKALYFLVGRHGHLHVTASYAGHLRDLRLYR